MFLARPGARDLKELLRMMDREREQSQAGAPGLAEQGMGLGRNAEAKVWLCVCACMTALPDCGTLHKQFTPPQFVSTACRRSNGLARGSIT